MATEYVQSHCFEPVPFSMAFQPIVDIDRERVYAYEALVRGPRGESADSIFAAVAQENRYFFDHCCRKRAIELAGKLQLPELGVKLALNFMPGAIYCEGSSVPDTLHLAEALAFPQSLLIFEINEREQVTNAHHLQNIADVYRRQGFEFAIDDFGAGFANLSLLADLSANTIKLDMSLIRGLHDRHRARKIVCAIMDLCSTLNIRVVAEGVETLNEFHALRECGVRFMQGFLLACPGFEMLPGFQLPSRLSFSQGAPPERILRLRSNPSATAAA